MAINFDNLNTDGGHAKTLDFSKAVSVESGERLSFTKDHPGVKNLRVEIYWESDADGDISVLLLNSSGKAIPNGIVFYNQLEFMGITHSGDVTGDTDGDPSTPEETITLNLDALTAEVDKIVFIASTYPSESDKDKAVPFGKLRDCRVLVINNDNDEVLYGYELDEDFSTYTSVELCAFYRRNEGFNMTNMGEGVGKSVVSLTDISAKYDL